MHPSERRRVLILGGTGCGGRAAAAALRARGHTVVTVARGRADVAPDVLCDRNQIKELHAVIQAARPDVIIDHVAYAPAEVEAVLSGFAGRHIFISSALVYGPARAEPYDEQSCVAPDGDFAVQKAAAEAVAQAAGAVVLRIGGLYGPGQAPLTPAGRDPSLLDRLRRGEPMPVPRVGGRLQPWFSGDHGRLLAALVEHPDPPPVLNAAGDELLMWPEVLATWARAAGAPAPECVPTDDVGAPAYLRPFLEAILRPPQLNTSKCKGIFSALLPWTPFERGTRAAPGDGFSGPAHR